MTDFLDKINIAIDSSIQSFVDFFEEVPGAVFLILIPVGFIHLLFGIRIYRILIGIFYFSAGAFAAYYLIGSYFAGAIIGIILATVAVILQHIFMITVMGVTFGLIVFIIMSFYFRGFFSLISAILATGIGIFTAVKIFRLIVIIMTSLIGSAMVAFSILVLKNQSRLLKKVDIASLDLDKSQMAIGFFLMFFLGIIVQGILLGRSEHRRK